MTWFRRWNVRRKLGAIIERGIALPDLESIYFEGCLEQHHLIRYRKLSVQEHRWMCELVYEMRKKAGLR